MKSRSMRLATAFIGSPLAGLLVSRLITAIESVMYPHAVDDDAALRAEAIVGPLLVPAFLVVCWFYVVPASWMLKRLHTLLTAFLITLPVWLAATAILHVPGSDPFWVTAAVIGVLVGLPVFASALIATAAFRPNKSAAPNGGPATQLGNSGVAEGPPSVS